MFPNGERFVNGPNSIGRKERESKSNMGPERQDAPHSGGECEASFVSTIASQRVGRVSGRRASPSCLPEFSSDPPRVGGEASRTKAKRLVADSGYVDRATRGLSRPAVAMEQSGVVTEDRDLEPSAEAAGVTNSNTGARCGSTVRRRSFRVSGEIAERRDATFNHSSRQTKLRSMMSRPRTISGAIATSRSASPSMMS